VVCRFSGGGKDLLLSFANYARNFRDRTLAPVSGAAPDEQHDKQQEDKTGGEAGEFCVLHPDSSQISERVF
jgi:hypothetical protein